MFATGCKKPTPGPPPDAPPPPPPPPPAEQVTYPLPHVIHDIKGRPLEGVIVGKTPGQLYLIRSADRMHFKIPIDTLAPEDREYAENLPVQVPPGDFREGTSSGAKKATPPYIATREDAIERLKKDIDRLTLEIDASSNSMLRKARYGEIDRKRAEIVELEAAIARYRAEHE